MAYKVKQNPSSQWCVFKDDKEIGNTCFDNKVDAVKRLNQLELADSSEITMSKLNKEQRDALPDSDFGDPDNRLFPIVDQDDVDSAKRLIGKAKDPEAVKKRIKAIAKKKDLKSPAAWDTPAPATMALAGTAGLSFEDIRTLVQSALQDEEDAEEGNTDLKSWERDYIWPQDIYANSVVYRDDDSLWKRPYMIDDNQNVILGEPVEVIQKKVYEPVVVEMATFSTTVKEGQPVSATDPEGWEYIIRSGKCFEAGDYPDKDYSMTREEIKGAVAAYSAPVKVDLEHTPTILDNKLGFIPKIWTPDEGQTMWAEYAEPAWLSQVVGDAARTVSATWDRATKTLKKVALALEPRVTDAVLMSGFADFKGKRHNKKDQHTIQQIHGLTYRLGAVCKPEEESAAEEAGESPATETAETPSVGMSAAPTPVSTTVVSQPAQPAKPKEVTMSVKPNPLSPMAMMNKFIDFFTTGAPEATAQFTPAVEAPTAPPPAKAEAEPEKPMTPPASPPGDTPAAPVTPPAPEEKIDTPVTPPSDERKPAEMAKTPDPEKEALQAQVAAGQAQLATLMADKIASDAAKFADGEIRNHRAFPVERDTLVAQFKLAAHDDLKTPMEVKFTRLDDKGVATEATGKRIDALMSSQLARPRYSELLTQEVLGKTDVEALFNATKTKAAGTSDMSDDRKKELLKKSPLGQAALKAMDAKDKAAK